MFKRAFYGTIFIFISITIIIFFFFTMIINIENIRRSYDEFNNQDTKNAVFFGIDYNKLVNHEDEQHNHGTEGNNQSSSEQVNEKTAMLKIFEELKKNNDIIIKAYGLDVGFENLDNNKGIYFNGKFNYPYNLIEGRFFNIQDFENKTKVVVIGKDIINKSIVEDGKRYLLRDNEKYEVIGVIGKKNYTTQYDDMILYNLNAMVNSIRGVEKGAWQLDSLVYSSEELKKIVQDDDTSKSLAAFQLDLKSDNVKRSINSNRPVIISFILVIIVVVLALIQAVFYWIEGLKLEIGVRKGYGASNSDIIYVIMQRYFIVAGSSTVFALCIVQICKTIFGIQLFQFELNAVVIASLFIVLLLLGLIPGLAAFSSIKNMNIASLLKEE